MTTYFLKCSTCKHVFSSENAPEYLCPDCSKKNKPGKPILGVLECFYDYDSWKKNHNRKNAKKEILFPNFPTSQLPNFNFLQVGNTPLYNSKKLAENIDVKSVFLKDETVEPTGSYKDRASQLVVAMALKKGYDKITCASTGNAASSLAGMCASAGLKSFIFVSASAPKAKLIQIASYGATLFPIDGTYDDCFELSLQATEKFGWYNRNTAYNPWTIEGKKTGAWEIAWQCNFLLPDQIFVPTGDGVIISGIYKGFFDLKQLGWIENIPKLVAVQPENSNAIYKAFFNETESICKPAISIADSLVVDAPRNSKLAVRCINNSNGYAITVSEEEIISAIPETASQTGIFVEPAAAAALAGLKKARENNKIKANESAVLLLTGTGLKNIAAAEKTVKISSPIPPDINLICV